MQFCSNCGLLLAPDQGFCPRCGAPAPVAPPQPPRPNLPAQPGPAASRAPQYTGPQTAAPNNTLSVGGYLLCLVLFNIPVIGFIIALVFACASANRARKNLAMAILLFQLILLSLVLLLYALGVSYLFLLPPAYPGVWS